MWGGRAIYLSTNQEDKMEQPGVNDSKIPRGLGIITNEHIFRIIDKIQKRLDRLEDKIFTVESPPKIPNIMEDKKIKKVKDK